MNRYPDTSMDFTSVLKKAVRLHYLTLKHTIPYIVLITLVKYITMMMTISFKGDYFARAIYYSASLIIFFFISAAILAAYKAFHDQAESFKTTIKETWQNSLKIYGAAFIYWLGSLFMLFIIYLLHAGFAHFFATPSHWHAILLMFTAVLGLAYALMFILSIPLVITEKCTIRKAFSRSIVLSEKNKFGIIILFLASLSLYSLVSPGMLQEYFLSMYYLDAVYDFVVLSVGIPLLINILLLLINDSKLQLPELE